MSFLLIACSGDDGSGADGAGLVAAPAPSPTTSTCAATGGIEGGGRSSLAGAVSEVGSDGQVTVGNVRFSTKGATTLVDGAAATVAAVQRGQVLTVTGVIDLAKQAGCADTILADASLIGTIEDIDAASRVLKILGQQIYVPSDATFGGGLRLDSLQVRDRVRVNGGSGLGSIVASRIDLLEQSGGYFISGAIAGLDRARSTFVLNGVLVDYSGAAIGGPTESLRDGSPVRVAGSAIGTDDSSTGRTVVKPDSINLIVAGLSIEPSPAITSVSETVQFFAGGVTEPVQWRVQNGDGSPCQAEACGRIGADGRYSAPVVAPPAPLLITATLQSDSSVFASTTLQISRDPVVLPGSYSLRGEVRGPTGPIADASVNMWVQQPRFGHSYRWANGPLFTDGTGQFLAPGLQESHVGVFVSAEGYYQPCAVSANIPADNAVQVQLLPAEVFDSSDPPRPNPAPEPWVTGQVYELTPAGRQPLAGAKIWLEDPMGILLGITLADREGEYFVCNVGNLPITAWITASKDGYQHRSVGPVDPTQSSQLDIELTRVAP
jgi:hypothetical protein